MTDPHLISFLAEVLTFMADYPRKLSEADAALHRQAMSDLTTVLKLATAVPFKGPALYGQNMDQKLQFALDQAKAQAERAQGINLNEYLYDASHSAKKPT